MLTTSASNPCRRNSPARSATHTGVAAALTADKGTCSARSAGTAVTVMDGSPAVGWLAGGAGALLPAGGAAAGGAGAAHPALPTNAAPSSQHETRQRAIATTLSRTYSPAPL